ncbi:MAG: hypothetical protein DRR00_13185 [Candidatus Parabeggiatoa sp. nov. 3]|nr:MAG: hypothetical protein DRR00_13185 [Gammaproteobacteria bacterium]RKZ61550.1 MAG: hypothetical protein DRQ99_20230 [Gammaproteobacteria bacterium]
MKYRINHKNHKLKSTTLIGLNRNSPRWNLGFQNKYISKNVFHAKVFARKNFCMKTQSGNAITGMEIIK